LVQVQLSLRAIVADPVHQLCAAKGSVVGMNAILEVALIDPFKQQWVLRCFKCWLSVPHKLSIALWTTTVIFGTLVYSSLPLVAACWALPLSREATASKYLLRCLGVFVLIPIL